MALGRHVSFLSPPGAVRKFYYELIKGDFSHKKIQAVGCFNYIRIIRLSCIIKDYAWNQTNKLAPRWPSVTSPTMQFTVPTVKSWTIHAVKQRTAKLQCFLAACPDALSKYVFFTSNNTE
jgi:hypothetical protein